MESDFINIVNELMRHEEPDLPTRLECQEEALNDLTCTDPTFGKWFEKSSIPYVLSALNLSDKDFASAFPRLKHLSTVERERVVQTFLRHIENCPRCFRQRGYDLEFEARFEATLIQNKEYLLTKLNCQDEEDESADEDHSNAVKTCCAHH